MRNNLNYEEFLDAIVEWVSGYYEGKAEVSLHSVFKNNSIKLDGITVMTEGCNISPTIYLNQFFDRYRDGQSFESICEDVICVYEQNRWESNLDTSFFRDFRRVSERIVFKLISYERNEEMLKDVPHKRILDLAIVYYYMLDAGQFENGTILIHESHMEYWDTSLEELDRIAKENASRILEASIRGITQILKPLMPVCFEEEEDERMFVISNRNSLFGAACILYPDVLKEFAIAKETDLYLLPSSVHEMIMIPVSPEVDVDCLKDMVKEVNATEVCDEEILSDCVYYYSVKENRIQFA